MPQKHILVRQDISQLFRVFGENSWIFQALENSLFYSIHPFQTIVFFGRLWTQCNMRMEIAREHNHVKGLPLLQTTGFLSS